MAIEVTPAGVVAYAFLYEKDTKFAKAEDQAKFKMTLVLDGDDEEVQRMARDISKDHDDNEGSEKNCPVKVGDTRVDKDGNPKEEFQGKLLFQFSSYYQPGLVDTDKIPLPLDPNTGQPLVKVISGDLAKVAFQRIAYDTGGNSGVTLRLLAVLLKEKRTGKEAGIAAFGDGEEGFQQPVPPPGPLTGPGRPAVDSGVDQDADTPFDPSDPDY